MSHEDECSICHREVEWFRHAIPTVNGDIVSNDFPDWLAEACGSGNQPVCEGCYNLHVEGEIETCDRDYLRHFYLVDGAGI